MRHLTNSCQPRTTLAGHGFLLDAQSDSLEMVENTESRVQKPSSGPHCSTRRRDR
ncbi:hypothetical protein OK016_21740 [Vibrio chagasii]|nr:hypothetical protein [Vibrio chagasii]